WLMASFFVVSIGSSVGIFSMIPLFLVNEMEMHRTWANTLIGLSRIFGIVVLFSSGWITSRFGTRPSMILFLAATASFTLLFGCLRGGAVTPVVMFLQAASVACLFPVGFTVISLLFPMEVRGIAVSLVMLVGFVLGAGILPSAIGHWAEAFSFSSAFILFGVLCLFLVPVFFRAGRRMEV
ncbi:MAG TPA: MFS transporter, partial [Thermodesulfobacteriota bacterium]|nr:MFS transporter [Thermodesulfobacteriota bacterium]